MNRRGLFASLAGDGSNCTPHPGSPGAAQFTNALLLTHENKRVKFYDDLIMGRQVIINLMYATCDGGCPIVTTKLVKIHQALRDRMGKDIFMYSITLKPEQDNPAALRRFAEMHKALLPGWTFLTGDPFDIETIRFRLFREDHIKFDADLDFHTAKLRLINDATNRWLHVSPYAQIETILKRISWTNPAKSFEERLKENEELQEKIINDVKRYGYRRTV